MGRLYQHLECQHGRWEDEPHCQMGCTHAEQDNRIHEPDGSEETRDFAGQLELCERDGGGGYYL